MRNHSLAFVREEASVRSTSDWRSHIKSGEWFIQRIQQLHCRLITFSSFGRESLLWYTTLSTAWCMAPLPNNLGLENGKASVYTKFCLVFPLRSWFFHRCFSHSYDSDDKRSPYKGVISVSGFTTITLAPTFSSFEWCLRVPSAWKRNGRGILKDWLKSNRLVNCFEEERLRVKELHWLRHSSLLAIVWSHGSNPEA